MSKNISTSYKTILESFNGGKNEIQIIDSEITLIDKAHVQDSNCKVTITDCTIAIEVLEGNGHIIINEVSHKIQAPCILILLPGLQNQIIFDDNYSIRAIMFSEKFANDFFEMSHRINEMLACLFLNPVINIDDIGYKQTFLYIACLKEIAKNKNNDNKLLCIKYLTLSFFYGSLSNYFNTDQSENRISSRISSIAYEFHNLLNMYYKVEHMTTFYAARLCISEKYLYLSIKAITGQTPSYWINLRLVNYAKQELTRSEKSILQISEELNFKSQSHFCRFFKNATGDTALKYRNKTK